MSNGYLVAAGADLAAAREISVGFGLEVVDADQVRDLQGLGDALARAANVGFVLSAEAGRDRRFVELMRALGVGLQNAQLILVDANAHAAFSFLPSTWPAMLLSDARTRAQRRREAMGPQGEPPQRAAPIPPPGPLGDLTRSTMPRSERPSADQAPPQPPPGPLSDLTRSTIPRADRPPPGQPLAPPPPPMLPTEPPRPSSFNLDRLADRFRAPGAPPPFQAPPKPEENPAEPPAAGGGVLSDLIGGVVKPDPDNARDSAPIRERAITIEESAPPPVAAEAPPEPPVAEAPAPEPEEAAPAAPSQEIVRHTVPAEDAMPELEGAGEARADAPAHDDAEFTPMAPAPAAQRSAPPVSRETAPADATAFAPKKLRRGTPELVRIVVHQPKDAKDVIKAAKKFDPYARPAPQGISLGDISLGANVGIALEVRGASCEGALQRRSWAGEPIDFSFPVQVEDDVKQAVFLARVFVDDAQIGVLAFTRQVIGAKKEEPAEEIRLTRHKRVFISYASADRETVSVIATAYQMAGVEHFWDRASLKGGEEWSPRLRQEIERADLFHLCWSKAAAQSEWVAKEAEHALKRRKNAKRPEITVQMLDGPPWAPHPRELDSINFDDFVRAAIVGYARGDGAS